MARKNIPDGQLSLFSDSDFEDLPRQDEAQQDEAQQNNVTISESPSERKEKETTTQTTDKVVSQKEEKITVRAKRLRLKVTFEDGTVACDASATQTMIEAIRKIGIERVAGLNMEVCHIPLVSREINPRYEQWIKKIDTGWYLMAQSDTRQKYMQLKSIISKLGINVKTELGNFEVFETNATAKSEARRKKKVRMEVKMGDKTITHATDTIYTFLDVAEEIGVDKVKKTNIKVGKFPIITPNKVANNQIQTSTGEWLTVPTLAKDKYKVLRVISSMTRTPMEIKIIE